MVVLTAERLDIIEPKIVRGFFCWFDLYLNTVVIHCSQCSGRVCFDMNKSFDELSAFSHVTANVVVYQTFFYSYKNVCQYRF